ncbi:hypothetical protein JHK82_016257 [Glycine max]|nr:hypothetical protein JHK85_016666 [Glycine max]KAG5046890.1 hypothetical protein JHK86_016296 [Glycine max]KAG5149376.1 hypothetical protein JHK82_016257 [Glycine max]
MSVDGDNKELKELNRRLFEMGRRLLVGRVVYARKVVQSQEEKALIQVFLAKLSRKQESPISKKAYSSDHHQDFDQQHLHHRQQLQQEMARNAPRAASSQNQSAGKSPQEKSSFTFPLAQKSKAGNARNAIESQKAPRAVSPSRFPKNGTGHNMKPENCQRPMDDRSFEVIAWLKLGQEMTMEAPRKNDSLFDRCSSEIGKLTTCYDDFTRLWNFAWPSAIAFIHPSLLPVVVMGFFTKVAIIVGCPLFLLELPNANMKQSNERLNLLNLQRLKFSA